MASTLNPEQVQKPTIEAVIDSEPSSLTHSQVTDSTALNGSVTTSATATTAPSTAPSSTSSTIEASAEAPKGRITTPIPTYHPSSKPLPPATLTPDQSTKYASLLATVSNWTSIPTASAKNAPTFPLTPEERMWLSRECLLRYLRATKWSPTEAPKRLLSTLIWRREYGLSTILTPAHISEENETGKLIIYGYDNNLRPCMYMNPSKQNTAKGPRQIQHLVYMLERVVDLMPPGQETTALLINYKGTTGSTNPSVAQGRETLNILQGHYPERLGRALISELPWYVTTFFKLISPFIDPVTKEKMKFNEPLSRYIPPSQLLKTYGGDVDFEYDHKDYWPALNELCKQRREEMMERWKRGGERIGEYEEYLRGGNVPSLAQTLEQGKKEGGEELAKAVEDLKVQA